MARGWSLPPPGSGATLDRWRALAELGARDLPLARLAEGHADACAVLGELGGPAAGPGRRLGVWAAEPPTARLVARRDSRGWRLDGRKAWCSGARVLTDVLVTATADDGPRLFLADLTAGGVAADAGVWAGPGMAGSDTADVDFTDVPAIPVGDVGGYVDRPGFWHGGIGVAAVWAGGAAGVAAALTAAASGGSADPFRALALGRVDVTRTGVDRGPDRGGRGGRRRPGRPARRPPACPAGPGPGRSGRRGGARRHRAFAGRGPLARDAGHAQRVTDLTVYLRQHHAERDVAALGELLRATPADPR